MITTFKIKDKVVVCAEDNNRGKVGVVNNIIPKKGFRDYSFNKIELKMDDDSTLTYPEWQLCHEDDLKNKKQS